MRFLEVISGWINEHFSNEEAIYLVVLLLVGFVVLLVLGTYLAPIVAGLIFAFLLHGIVNRLVAWHVPRLAAVWLVFVLFMGSVVALVIGIAPLIWRQLTNPSTPCPASSTGCASCWRTFLRTSPAFFSPMATDRLLGRAEFRAYGNWNIRIAGAGGTVADIFGIIIS